MDLETHSIHAQMLEKIRADNDRIEAQALSAQDAAAPATEPAAMAEAGGPAPPPPPGWIFGGPVLKAEGETVCPGDWRRP